jgi:hypothetical protein
MLNEGTALLPCLSTSFPLPLMGILGPFAALVEGAEDTMGSVAYSFIGVRPELAESSSVDPVHWT